MNRLDVKESYWIACTYCQGRGKRSRRLRKKVRLSYLKELTEFEQMKGQGPAPIRPKAHLELCLKCAGSGLLPSDHFPVADTEHYPHVAIIGGGIGVWLWRWRVCTVVFLLRFMSAIVVLMFDLKAMD
ncbi:hypothetical protein [Marinomonas rhodophyticola]|uniref:Uncharacterized protein n=1 Tax=Marinomonas rhodophyticola TaxID=2992803 RepID=A0ABT3KCM7_9GAMM|nr:hypothetical protein [Marinomonas sp. KJ51-3]MCW4628301.1 hypothetical protein [Marinomonas sp. KJ51-3]